MVAGNFLISLALIIKGKDRGKKKNKKHSILALNNTLPLLSPCAAHGNENYSFIHDEVKTSYSFLMYNKYIDDYSALNTSNNLYQFIVNAVIQTSP